VNKTEAARVIKDPDNHFPYKRDEALAAGLPEWRVDLAEAVVNAQQAYLEDPSEENLQARKEAEQAAQRAVAEYRGGVTELGEAADDAVRPATVDGKAE
jgi:hypothetical protein